MGTHAKLSPSSAYRWRACPGSVREAAKYPEQSSGDAAIDGTHTHTVLTECLVNLIVYTNVLLGTTMSDHEGEFVIDVERLRRVDVALEYIRSKDGFVFSEIPVQFSSGFGEEGDLSGTIDVVIENNDTCTLEVIDYKDGRNVVEVVDNKQLQQYAVAYMHDKPWLRGYRVIATIIQPKNFSNPISSVELQHLGGDQIVKTELSIIADAHAAYAEDAPLVPGEKQCHYCPANGKCSATLEQGMGQVVQFFKKEKMEQSLPEYISNNNPNELTNEQIAEVLEKAPFIRSMLDAIQEEAFNRANNGGKVPGFKLVTGPGSRGWVTEDEESLVKSLTKLGIPKKSLFVTKIASPAQIEKLSWEEKDGTKVSLSKIQIDRMNKDFVNRKEGRLLLVPESDDRTEVASVKSMFSKVESVPSWLT